MTLTRDRKTELLAATPLFSSVDATGLEHIAEKTVEVEFPADRVIARQGEVGTGFFIVASEPTMCLGLASWDFETVIRDQPSVALAIMRGLAERLRDLTEGTRH